MLILGIFILIYLCYAIIPFYFYKVIYRMNRNDEKKIVYLTFDDGPSEYTEQLLDLLKKEEIKASFFCVASFMERYPSIIKKMNDEGHIIGFHSYKHISAFFMLPWQVEIDFKKSIAVANKMKKNIFYYRPPWGHVNLWTIFCCKRVRMKMLFWHVMAEDWEEKSTSLEIEQKLLRRIKNGSIICLHDGRGKNSAPLRTIEALKKVLPILKREGYSFKTVDQL